MIFMIISIINTKLYWIIWFFKCSYRIFLYNFDFSYSMYEVLKEGNQKINTLLDVLCLICILYLIYYFY